MIILAADGVEKTVAIVYQAAAIACDDCPTDTGSAISAKTGLFPIMRTEDPLYGKKGGV
jgi:hypothetical protein